MKLHDMSTYTKVYTNIRVGVSFNLYKCLRH